MCSYLLRRRLLRRLRLVGRKPKPLISPIGLSAAVILKAAAVKVGVKAVSCACLLGSSLKKLRKVSPRRGKNKVAGVGVVGVGTLRPGKVNGLVGVVGLGVCICGVLKT